MRKLPVFSTLTKTFGSLGRNFFWLLGCSIPLFVLHSYMAALADPIIRISFVNQALRPFGFGEGKDFTIRYVEGFGPQLGNGYDLPVWLTVTFVAVEFLVACLVCALLQKRIAKEGSSGDFTPMTIGSYLLFSVWAAVSLSVCAGFVFGAAAILPGLIDNIKMIYGQNASVVIGFVQVVTASLASIVLLKLAVAMAAIATNDDDFIFNRFSTVFRMDFWRTVGINSLMAICFVLISLLVQPFHFLIITSNIPTGIGIATVALVAIIVLQFLFQLYFTFALSAQIYRHYTLAE